MLRFKEKVKKKLYKLAKTSGFSRGLQMDHFRILHEQRTESAGGLRFNSQTGPTLRVLK